MPCALLSAVVEAAAGGAPGGESKRTAVRPAIAAPCWSRFGVALQAITG